jgi:hypothetical protein
MNCRADSSSNKLPGFCDWFEPKRYFLDGPSPRILGRVGFVDGRNSTVLAFTLCISRAASSPGDIDWPTLLPQDNTTGWVSIDPFRGCITIDPAHA